MAPVDAGLARRPAARRPDRELPVALRKRYDMLIAARAAWRWSKLAAVPASAVTCTCRHSCSTGCLSAKEVQTCPHCNRLLYVVEQD